MHHGKSLSLDDIGTMASPKLAGRFMSRRRRLSPRRILYLLTVAVVFSFFVTIWTLPRYMPDGPSLSKFADLKSSIPTSFKSGLSTISSSINPFHKIPSHPPPRQSNDTDGSSSWYADWKWLSQAFSSSVTLDENRSLLPPLTPRPPVYCYYDTTVDRDAAEKEAEGELLLTWRRAWWAQGFKPIILSAAEAMNNPKYQELQRMGPEPRLKTELMRWLAWENMGGGILANYLLFPMAAYDDPLLSFLRRGKYPALTRWEGLESGLFAGGRAEVAEVLKMAFTNTNLANAHTMIDAVASDQFHVDPTHQGIAYYDAATLEKRYPKVAEEVASSRAKGLASLRQLIDSHLHLAWRHAFPHGIVVLKPHAEHTTRLVDPALTLANFLAQCPQSPMPTSCPPNHAPRECTPCIASSPMRVTTPGRYRNTSTLYTIGTVPHPYTLASLANLRADIDVPWVRRKQEKRDVWLFAVTQELSGTGVGGAPRVLRFKEAVAGAESWRSLWLAAEDLDFETPTLPLQALPQGGHTLDPKARLPKFPDDLDWRLGFTVPRTPTDRGESPSPVPGPERAAAAAAAHSGFPDGRDPENGPAPPPEAELKQEPGLIRRAVALTTRSRKPADVKVRDAIEAWNLADAEAWRFARAFAARARMERLKWLEEEAKYAGGVGSGNGW